MRPSELDVVVDRRRVEVRSAERVLATGVWDGRVIRDRSGALTDGDDEPIWAALAARLAADEQAALAAAESDAFDENGVDLTMIRLDARLDPDGASRSSQAHRGGPRPLRAR